MSTFRLSPVLRRVLLADAVISGANGLLMFVSANVPMDALNLPAALCQSGPCALCRIRRLRCHSATCPSGSGLGGHRNQRAVGS